jgi:LuxR family transcriptional regulator, maltose regulon positive regulatory protein
MMHDSPTSLAPQYRSSFRPERAVVSPSAESFRRVQAAADSVDTILFTQSNFNDLDASIAVLEGALARDEGFTDDNGELRARSAALGAIAIRRGDQPYLRRHIERLLVLLRGEADVTLKTTTVTHLLGYAANFGHLSLALRVLPAAELLLMRSDIAASRKAWCAFAVGWCYVNFPNPAKTEASIARLEAIAGECRLPSVRRLSAIIGFWHERYYRRLDGMARWLGVFEDAMNPASICDLAQAHTLRAILHLDRGRPLHARPHAREAVHLGDEYGCPAQRLLARGILAHALLDGGDFTGASHVLEEARTLGQTLRMRVFLLHILEANAWRARIEGGAHYREQLINLFEAAQEFGSHHALRFFPTWMSVLCAHALTLQVCPEFVRHLVVEWNWLPPNSLSAHWPWTLSIKTFGEFEIKLRDGPLPSTRKAPTRLLSLLKALIALGCVNVPEHKLIDVMWPEEEGDAGHGALQVALTRLRRLFGRQDAVYVIDGKVSLNTEVCWVDSLAFEHLSSGITGRSGRTLDANHVAAADSACALYRGNFLAGEDAPWARATRERLRDRLIQLLELLAAHHESHADWTRAAILYRLGTETDPLFEKFHQGLIRCNLNAGEHAEALSTYRKMCNTLSLVLGIEPSTQSQALYQDIYHLRAPSRSGSCAAAQM